MKQNQQRQLDALRRAQDFLDAHAATVGSLADSEGRTQLDDAVTRLATFGDGQGSANLQMAGQISRERALAADLIARHMRPIATFARAKLRGVPDFAALTRSPRELRGAPLVRAARAMATAAAPHAGALTRGGFPADTVPQLGAAADAVDSALEERANTKVSRVGATRGIQDALVLGHEAVAMLHAVISRQFAGDPTFLAAWRSAHRVSRKPGAPRATVATPAVTPVVSPTLTPGVVAGVGAPSVAADINRVAVAAHA